MTSSPTQPKLLDQVSGKIRVKHYSIRTVQVNVDWIKRFIIHFDKRHPRDLGAAEIEAFLTHLAVEGRVAASTQNQAKSAILFLYREVSCQGDRPRFFSAATEYAIIGQRPQLPILALHRILFMRAWPGARGQFRN